MSREYLELLEALEGLISRGLRSEYRIFKNPKHINVQLYQGFRKTNDIIHLTDRIPQITSFVNSINTKHI